MAVIGFKPVHTYIHTRPFLCLANTPTTTYLYLFGYTSATYPQYEVNCTGVGEGGGGKIGPRHGGHWCVGVDIRMNRQERRPGGYRREGGRKGITVRNSFLLVGRVPGNGRTCEGGKGGEGTQEDMGILSKIT